MRHQRSGKKLGRDSAHRKALYANLAGALIEHGRIRTTVTKAKAVRPIAEQMITLGRRGDLHARRQAKAFLRSQDVVHKLFSEVGPSFAERPGGYTRIVRIGPRAGDAAEMAYLELVDTPLEPRSRTNGADAETVEAPVATAAAETVDEAATEDDVPEAATDAEEPDEEGESDDEAEESDDQDGSAEPVAGAEAAAADDDEAAPPAKDV